MKNSKPPDANSRWDLVPAISYGSLCSNCRNSNNCAFHKGSAGPVAYCEEFAIAAPSGKQKSSSEIIAAAIETDSDDGGELIGLCSNCAGRETCGFPRPEGGVWHCEEYR